MPSRRLAVLLALTLSAALAGAAPAAAQDAQTPVCHYTGDSSEPYILLVLDDAAVEGHLDHDLDLIPPPPAGCPEAQVVDPGDAPEPTPSPTAPATVTICHEGVGRLYETLTTSRAELDTHVEHVRDVIPAPAAGCPRRAERDTDDDRGRERDGGDRGSGGSTRDGTGAPQPGGAPTPAAAPASVSATAQLPASLPVTGGHPDVLALPVTGGHPDVLALLGLSMLLGGAGMRLRGLSRPS